MFKDSENSFSEKQKITETSTSTNVVKMASTENGMTEVAFGKPIPLLIQVEEDFEGLSALKVAVETSATEDFNEKKTLAEASATLEELKTGFKFPINFVPKGNLGYMRLQYTPTGTATAGAITAGIVASHDHSFQDM